MSKTIVGSTREGAEVLEKWINLYRQQVEAGHGTAVLCGEVERLGFDGMVQEIAHLMSLRAAAEEFLTELGGELHRHFPDEVAKARGEQTAEERQAAEAMTKAIPLQGSASLN